MALMAKITEADRGITKVCDIIYYSQQKIL